MRRVLVINGPNLNLLGRRDPTQYGTLDLAGLEAECVRFGAELGVEVETFQSNHEGALIDVLHATDADGVILNAGAYTHYSYALHDAIEAIDPPVVEVHISNVLEREEWRRRSVISPACCYSIYGRGVDGYRWGLRHLVARAAWPFVTLGYGPDTDQAGDLRLPDGVEQAPLVVVVHGGFWRHQWTRDSTDAVSVDLARRGVASFNIEYRRVGAGGGGVLTVDDVERAIRSVSTVPGVDPSRWAIVGHSAGGQLALLAAGRMARRSQPPRLAVSLAGLTDLVAAHRDHLGDGAADAYLGTVPATELSPLHHVPLGVPTVLAHGTDDDVVPITQAEAYVEAASAAGDDAELVATPGGGHFEFLEPDQSMWSEVADRLVESLR